MNYTYFDYKLHTTVLLRSHIVVGFTNLSSFMTCNRIFSRTNPRGVTGGTGTANPSRVDSCFCVSQSFVFCEGNLSTVFFSFFHFWLAIIFVLWLRMAPLLSSDLSYNVFTNQNVAYKSYFFMQRVLFCCCCFMLTVIMYHLHKDWNKIVLDKLTHPIQYQGQRVGLN